jgi:hypothetical protein
VGPNAIVVVVRAILDLIPVSAEIVPLYSSTGGASMSSIAVGPENFLNKLVAILWYQRGKSLFSVEVQTQLEVW